MELSREKINICMARNEMTITKLSEVSGYSRARIHAILNSKRVTPLVAGRIAKALNVDITEILEEN